MDYTLGETLYSLNQLRAGKLVDVQIKAESPGGKWLTVEIKEGQERKTIIYRGWERFFTRDPDVIIELLHGELGELRDRLFNRN